ncbi:DUF6906 family protein [Paenibacillus sp. YYML68]|uniref:DUF6906 family protein n=1 Tax=Paenibacillus sp. YYML68 TaxID=2909250 RepID=UPI00249096F2|nr:hypothetical protein [Paenibacillus sp. YYML68]
MKQGKNPTRKQKELIKSYGLNYQNWLVERVTSAEVVIVHRMSGTVRKLRVGA